MSSENKWFTESGEFIGELSPETVAACSHSGDCLSDVQEAIWELSFTVPDREQAERYLQEFGCWTPEELEGKTQEEIDQLIFWIICGEISERGVFYGLNN